MLLTDLELADVVVDVVQVTYHHSFVLHHVIQHGQPVDELGPGLVELSQPRGFRQGRSSQTFIWGTKSSFT